MSGNPLDVGDYPGLEGDERPVPEDHEFVLLLTHDVDRPYKTFQAPYYALLDSGNRLQHLRSLLPGREPYWQFETVMALEDSLGVRSAFYFLSEQRLRERPVREWFSLRAWQLYAGRYSLSDPAIQRVVTDLDDGGWEVGLHGSFDSPLDRNRLRAERDAIEEVVGHGIVGGRQHYLNLSVPETWRHYRALGLRYDASLGSSEETGFPHGYGVKRPFDDEFVVFPLTMMENALPDPDERFADAWTVCSDLLTEAARNDAVMTVLWHPRVFNSSEYPGYGRLYYRLVETALSMGAWVGSPSEFYAVADLDQPATPNPSR